MYTFMASKIITKLQKKEPQTKQLACFRHAWNLNNCCSQVMFSYALRSILEQFVRHSYDVVLTIWSRFKCKQTHLTSKNKQNSISASQCIISRYINIHNNTTVFFHKVTSPKPPRPRALPCFQTPTCNSLCIACAWETNSLWTTIEKNEHGFDFKSNTESLC